MNFDFEFIEGGDLAPPKANFDQTNHPSIDFAWSNTMMNQSPIPCLIRNSDPPPLEFEPDEETNDAVLSGNIIRNHDSYVQELPPDPHSFSKSPKQSLKPRVPDVSLGLGQRQAKKDIVALAKYMSTTLILMVYQDELYEFKPPCWKYLKKKDACTRILEILNADEINGCLVDSDALAIYRRLIIDPNLQHRQELEPPSETINFRDGTYNIMEQHFYEHRPEDEFTYFIDVDWSEVCSSPSGETFEAFVASSGDGNPLVRQQLLELVALALTGTELKYFYVLLGQSHTGKTQFGRFLEELVGKSNVQSLRGVGDFGDRWVGGQIAGCRLVTCLDLPDKPLPASAVAMIKQLVGDDSVKGERKYKDPFTFYRKPLLLFAGNHPIRVPNIAKEEALLNRMVVIPFANPCDERDMIQHLYKELLREAPYIVREAIAAFEALADRNYQITRSEIPAEFQPEDGRRAVRDIEKFIQSCCELNAEQETSSADLWDAYCLYTESRDSAILNQIDFSRNLAQVLESIKIIRPLKRVNGTDARGYRGITLKSL